MTIDIDGLRILEIYPPDAESAAENYLEMHFYSEATGPLVTTVQRLKGKTPHQLRAEAEKERDELRALVDTLRLEISGLHTKIAQMERQVPICRAEDLKHAESLLPALGLKPENHLYALPGAHPKPDCGEAGHDEGRCGNKQCLPGAQPALSMPNLHVGNLPTANQDAYPALGAWWVQLWDGDDVIARVYGATPEEAHGRAVMLAATGDRS